MIVPNLNPTQLAAARSARPQSASLRTPRGGDASFNRMNRAADDTGERATPRLPAPSEEVQPGEEEPWLFSFDRCLTTLDIWKMGFSRCIVFGAHHWVDETVAAAELSEAFRASSALPGLGQEHKAQLEAIIAPCFLKGDVLMAVQCTQCAHLPADERRACLRNVAKLLDCVSNVWCQYDEMAEAELGAVVCVLEGETRRPTPPARRFFSSRRLLPLLARWSWTGALR